MQQKILGALLLAVLLSGWYCTPRSAKMVASSDKALRLVWSDEFEQQGLPDSTRWGYDAGDGCPNVCGWGNNELQYYTRSSKNARVDKGRLIVEAHREKMGSKDYTSARLVSKFKGDWTYGRILIKAKLPKGLGVWPAVWMLPTDWKYGGWPASGEIDIMEHVGYMPDSLFGSVHTKSFNHAIGTQSTKGIYSNDLAETFHEYGIDWYPDRIDFLFDGKVFHSFANQKTGADAWPFDQRFHLLLNIAVGGNWGGKMGVDETIWPQRMEVDYVRVFAFQ